MKINIINKGLAVFAFVVAAMQLTSCQEDETLVFDTKPALYFPNYEKETSLRGIDSAYVSFFHNPGLNELTIPFKVSLVGQILKQDTEYRIEIIDSLTTAKSDEFELPEKLIFRKGVVADSLYVKVFKTARLNTTDARVTIKLIENDNFGLAYYDKLIVKLRFDNLVSKPTWWDNEIDYVYMGLFSPEKFTVFVKVSGQSNIDGIEAWELRKICLDMKKYIADNGITEADGSEMEIAAY